jgi:uncharacterized protein Yka (UPF0111/DUF47 family)
MCDAGDVKALEWFSSHYPDVLGLLRRHAEITRDGLDALARWSATAADDDAQAVRDAEHDADEVRRELLEALTTALTTPIEQEHAYALSERIDEVMDSAKDTVRIAGALRWSPDDHAAAMAGCAAESAAHLVDAIGKLGDRHTRPGDDVELAIKAARRVEHALLAGLAALEPDADPFARSATLEVYRRYSALGQALVRVADRTWYTVLKVL